MSPKRLAGQAKVGATSENGRTTESAPSLREQTRGDDHIRLRSCDRMSIVAPTSVYLYYDSNAVLIYVGITSRGVTRNHEHNTTKDWWQFVVRQEVEHYPTREEAAAREKSLISTHCPPFNIQHNVAHREIRKAYLLFKAAVSQPENWKETVRAMQMRVDLDAHEFGEYDHIVLRTRLDDVAVVAAIPEAKFPIAQRPRAFGYRKVKAVVQIEKRGPLALIHLNATRTHPILDGYANIQFAPNQRQLAVRNVHIRLDHSDPSMCTSKCPQPPRTRWIRDGKSGAA